MDSGRFYYNGTWYDRGTIVNGTYYEEDDFDLESLTAFVRCIIKISYLGLIFLFYIARFISRENEREDKLEVIFEDFGEQAEKLIDTIENLDDLIPAPGLFLMSMSFGLLTLIIATFLAIVTIIHKIMECHYKRMDKKRNRRLGIGIKASKAPPPMPVPHPPKESHAPETPANGGEQEQVLEIYTNVNITEDNTNTVNRTTLQTQSAFDVKSGKSPGAGSVPQKSGEKLD